MGPPRGLCVEAGLIETDLPPPNFPPWISLRRCRAVMPHAASTHPPASRRWIRRLVKFKFSRSCRLRRRKGENGVRQGESPHNQPAEPLAERTDGDGGPFSPTTRSRSFFRARGEGGAGGGRRGEVNGGKGSRGARRSEGRACCFFLLPLPSLWALLALAGGPAANSVRERGRRVQGLGPRPRGSRK